MRSISKLPQPVGVEKMQSAVEKAQEVMEEQGREVDAAGAGKGCRMCLGVGLRGAFWGWM